MAMSKGDSDCTTGFSKRVYDYLVADRARAGFTGSALAPETNFLKFLSWATAQAVYDELTIDARDSANGHIT